MRRIDQQRHALDSVRQRGRRVRVRHARAETAELRAVEAQSDREAGGARRYALSVHPWCGGSVGGRGGGQWCGRCEWADGTLE